MPSAPDSSDGLPLAPEQREAPVSLARDTVPTGLAPRSTLPPERASPDPWPSAPEVSAGAQPASDVRALGAEAEHTTLHSASHPGSSNHALWDERRILHLEHEFDQVSAQNRLLGKRIDALELRLRSVVALAFLALLFIVAYVVARP